MPEMYSALLLYPDYVAEDYGDDRLWASVEADSPAEAVQKLQQKLSEANDGAEPIDFACLVCIRGQHDDINPHY